MSVLPIARIGEPILRARAREIEDAASNETARLAADMIETMEAANGIGLAAPQVRVGQRLIVFYDRFDEEEQGEPVVLVNPTFEPLDAELDTRDEGCLSIPGLRGPVPRFERIRYGGLDLAGRPIQREADGLHARVVQHEIDHLDGIVFLERMDDVGALAFADVIAAREDREDEGEDAA